MAYDELHADFLQPVTLVYRGSVSQYLCVQITTGSDLGKKLEAILRWFEETEKWSYEDLLTYQEERLKALVSHAYETVPYYREKMKSLNLSPG